MNLRKTLVIRETIESDETNESCASITRVAALAVVKNPFAGRFVEDLSPLFDLGCEIGELLRSKSCHCEPERPIAMLACLGNFNPE